MPQSADYAGRWLGCYRDGQPESFLELVISRGSGEDLENKWILRLVSRAYRVHPEVQLIFVSKSRFETFVPNWILEEPYKVRLVGEFRDDRLYLKIFGLGMTGMDDITSPVELVRDPKRWASFLRPRDPRKALPPRPFDALVASVLKDYAATSEETTKPRIDALAIAQDEETVFEEFFWGNSKDGLHMISSCTKSITSILAGIAIDQGLFSLDDEVVKFFPWISNTTWGESPPILVRHVLSMTSGAVDEPSRSRTLLITTDVEEFVLSARRECAPGTRYQYDNGLPCLVGCLIERRSKLRLEDFAEKYLFGPLGIKQYEWSRMRPSTSKVPPPSAASPVVAAGGFFLGLDSMMKLGRLLLGMGLYENHRIVSEAYIQAATSRQTSEQGYPYGFYFHINTPSSKAGRHIDLLDGYFALGQGEQFFFVSPKKKLVMAGFSSSWFWPKMENPPDDTEHRASYRVFDVLSETIVPEL